MYQSNKEVINVENEIQLPKKKEENRMNMFKTEHSKINYQTKMDNFFGEER